MARPWMPLWVADYLRDTRGLCAAEHGAYLLLIMEYWTVGCLPADDDRLARIASMTPQEWKKAKPVVQSFFHDGWKHKRVEDELAKAESVSGANSSRAKLAAAKRWRQAKPEVCSEHAPSISQAKLGGEPENAKSKSKPLVDDGGETRAPARKLISEEAFEIAGEVLEAMGLHREDPKSVGAPMTVQSWLNGGWPREVIVVGVQRAMANRGGDPPGTLKYFEKAIARQHAENSRPLPVATIRPQENFSVTAREKPRNAIIQAADDLCQRIASFDGPARRVDELRSGEGQTPVRQLSNG